MTTKLTARVLALLWVLGGVAFLFQLSVARDRVTRRVPEARRWPAARNQPERLRVRVTAAFVAEQRKRTKPSTVPLGT